MFNTLLLLVERVETVLVVLDTVVVVVLVDTEVL
jgi:hypothetical protein